MVAWVGSACTSACVVKGGLEFVLIICFALSSLVSGNLKQKFEIDRKTLLELTLILSLN